MPPTHVGSTQSMISTPEPEPEPEPDTEPEKSQEQPPCSSARLENLPADIRRYLLFTLDYEELKTLINASPIYHQQYLLDRQCLRHSCLERTLGYISADAYAVYESRMDDFWNRGLSKVSLVSLISTRKTCLSPIIHFSDNLLWMKSFPCFLFTSQL